MRHLLKNVIFLRTLISLWLGLVFTAPVLLILFSIDKFFNLGVGKLFADIMKLIRLPFLDAFKISTVEISGQFFVIYFSFVLFIFVFKSKRLHFFLFSSQDTYIMDSLNLSDRPTGLIPWVHWEKMIPNLLNNDEKELSHGGRYKQAMAMKELCQWLNKGVGDGRWGGKKWFRIWPEKPTMDNQKEWLPLSLSLLRGANGVGKTQLAIEFGHLAARTEFLGLRSSGCYPKRALMSNWKRNTLGLRNWFFRCMPFTKKASDDSWDVGRLNCGDIEILALLERWEPRKPTLFIIDEPDENSEYALQALEKRRNSFWHPVRILFIDQTFPSMLMKYANKNNKSVPIEYSENLNLGFLKFDDAAVRILWNTLWKSTKPEPHRNIIGRVARNEQIIRLLILSEGNPLYLSLILNYLIDEKKIPEIIYNTSGTQEFVECLEFEVGSSTSGRNQIMHQIIHERAMDLVNSLTREFSQNHLDVLEFIEYVCAATVCGGLFLPSPLNGKINYGLINNFFINEGFIKNRSIEACWLPPVKPCFMSHAFLDAYLSQKDSRMGACRNIAIKSIQRNLSGSLRAVRNPGYLPADLYAVLLDTIKSHTSHLEYAIATCEAFIFENSEDESCLATLATLSPDELEQFELWLENRLDTAVPNTVKPSSSICLFCRVFVLKEAGTGKRKKKDEWIKRNELFQYWSRRAGHISNLPVSTGKQVSSDLCLIIDKIFSTTQSSPYFTLQFFDYLREILEQGYLYPLICFVENGIEFLGSEEGSFCEKLFLNIETLNDSDIPEEKYKQAIDNQIITVHLYQIAFPLLFKFFETREAYQKALFYAGKVEEISHREIFNDHSDIQCARSWAWSYVTYAASNLADKSEAYQKALQHAGKVEEISHREIFNDHSEIQGARSWAWSYVTFAASNLADKSEAYQKARHHAGKVEEISHREIFNDHSEIQAARSWAWSYVTYAASNLADKSEAYQKALQHAGKVEEISHREIFNDHSGIQRARSWAWSYVTYAASNLADKSEAYQKARQHAGKVEEISHREIFNDHSDIQGARSWAWSYVTYAASNLADKSEAYQKARQHAGKVEEISHREIFNDDSDIQGARSWAWSYVTRAASNLADKSEAYQKARQHAGKVEEISHREIFNDHSDIQGARSWAWSYVTRAASNLADKSEAYQKARQHAGKVEEISHREIFNDHSDIQRARSWAWSYVTYAASNLADKSEAYQKARQHAGKVEEISHREIFNDHSEIQRARSSAWHYVTRAASNLADK